MSERSRRHDFFPTVVRAVSDVVSDGPLIRRAEEIAESWKLEKHLKEYASRVEAEKGVSVLSIGSGKGHELVVIGEILRGLKSRIVGLDPHDYHIRSVEKRLKKMPHQVEFLSESVRAEDLKGVEDASMDVAVLQYVLHHIGEGHFDQVMSEARRVLKGGGLLFVAEDPVFDEEERKRTERMDRRLNVEFKKDKPHDYKDTVDWHLFFQKHGFKVVEVHDEIDNRKIRHCFFVLEKLANVTEK